MSFVQNRFGCPATPECHDDHEADPTKGYQPEPTPGVDGPPAIVDLENDYRAELEAFSTLESDVRHFIAMSRAAKPTGDCQVVVQTLRAIEARRALCNPGGLLRRFPGRRIEAPALVAARGSHRSGQRVGNRHVEAANLQRDEREESCRQLREEIETLRIESGPELAQMSLELLKNQTERFERQQEKLRKAMENPYYTYELDD